VSAGGTAHNLTVSSGGTLNVAGRITSNVTVSSSGIENVLSGGTESGTVVSNGGTLELFGGAVADLFATTVVGSGGKLEIGSGYTLTGYTVSSGVTLEAASGGVVSSATISGGRLEVASGGLTGSGPTTFTSAGGDLQLDASLGFHGLVAGFGSPPGVTEEIDLRDIAFGSSTTRSFIEASNHLSGTLTVTDGVHTANIALLGQYMASQFHLATDGPAGTLVTDPPAATTSALLSLPHA
jgi:autotransporter passenger strand-loop-strand repeat protein